MARHYNGGIKLQVSGMSVCLSLPCLHLKNGVHESYRYNRTLIGNPTVEVAWN